MAFICTFTVDSVMTSLRAMILLDAPSVSVRRITSSRRDRLLTTSSLPACPFDTKPKELPAGLLGNSSIVVSLARQATIIPTFQTLLPSQREALARDWHNGHKLLTAHKDFLRAEVRSLRRKPLLYLGKRAVLAFLDEHPVGLLVLIGVLALAIALVRALV